MFATEIFFEGIIYENLDLDAVNRDIPLNYPTELLQNWWLVFLAHAFQPFCSHSVR
jgi:hypothetical protein